MSTTQRNLGERDVEVLLALSVESAGITAAGVAQAVPGCIGMARLEAIAAGAAENAIEHAHLLACARCGLRREAFAATTGGVGIGSTTAAVPVGGVRRFWLMAALTAAASLLAGVMLVRVMLLPGGEGDPAGNPPEHGPERAAVASVAEEDCNRNPLDVCFALVSRPADPAVVQVPTLTVEVSAPEDRVAVAILRAWDDDCQCLRTHLHRWHGEDGKPSSHLEAGELHTFDVQLSSPASVEQHLLLVTAEDAESLPGNEREAEDFIACLDGQCGSEGLELAAVSCIAAPVCVVRHSFVP